MAYNRKVLSIGWVRQVSMGQFLSIRHIVEWLDVLLKGKNKLSDDTLLEGKQ